VENRGGFVSTTDAAVAGAFVRAGADTSTCIGREIPRAEIDRFLPGTAAGVRMFEPAAGCFFGRGKADGPLIGHREGGGHGHWPTRYRASYLVSGPGVAKGTSPGMDMREVAAKWAAIIGVAWPPR
jgi:hypothetical protein